MKNLKLIGIVGKTLWIIGLLLFVLSVLVKNENIQKLVTENIATSNLIGNGTMLIGISLLIPGIILLIIQYRNTENEIDTDVTEAELSQEELQQNERMELRETIKNNLPFLFVRMFFCVLTIAGIASVVIENLSNYKYVIFGILLIIFIGFITYYFFRKIKISFEELKKINRLK